MTQKKSQSSMFCSSTVKAYTLFRLMFDDVKQMLQRFLNSYCRRCLINRVLEMSPLCFTRAICRLRHIQHSQLFAQFSAYDYQFCTLLLIYAHQYVCISILRSSTPSFSVHLAIIVQYVTSQSHNNKNDV